MKRWLTLALILFLSAYGCNSLISESQPIQQAKIGFEQKGKLIKPVEGVLKLKKEPFDIVFEIPLDMGVFINTSYTDSISKVSARGSVPTIFNKSNVIAIDIFNTESTIYLADDSINTSYYANEEEHTFNTVSGLHGGHRGIRTVTKIYDIDASEAIELKHVNAPIYLVFASENFKKHNTSGSFLTGQNLKIEWED